MNTNYINLQKYGKANNFGGAIDCNHKQEDVWQEAITKSGFMSEYVDRLHLLNWLKEHYTLIKK